MDFRRVLALNPAIVVAAGVFNGALPLVLGSVRGFGDLRSEHALLPLAVCAGLALAAWKVPLSIAASRSAALRLSAKFAVFSVLGAFSAWHASIPPLDSIATVLPERDCGAEIRGHFVDTRVGGPALPWLNPPRLVKAEIEYLRLTPQEEWLKVSGTALIAPPPNSPLPLYGTPFRARGAFTIPDTALIEGGFDYRRHLLSRGIRRIFHAMTLESDAGSTTGLWTELQGAALRFRDWCLRGLTTGMGLAEKKTLAALMFGCRQAVGRGTRAEYIRSGVAHVFAISGLHVGMLAAALFVLFRIAPFRFRYFSVPLLLSIYVLTTGSQPSALRAFLMITLWSLNKAALRRSSPLNAVFLAAAVITLSDPLSVLGAGFQYSFAIAAFLVVSWRSSGEWLSSAATRLLFIPRGHVSKGSAARLTSTRWILNALSTSVIAWLAATGLNLARGNIVVPGAVFANLLIVPIVWALFACAAIAAPLVPFHSAVAAPLLDFLVGSIMKVASVGSMACGWTALPTPPAWSLALYFAALTGLAVGGNRKTTAISASVLALCVAGWVWNDATRPGSVTAFHGGGSQSISLVCVPPGGGGGAIVVNAGAPRRARTIVEFLRLRGVDSIDTLYFSNADKACCEGSSALFAGTTVDSTVLPWGYAKSRYAIRAAEAARRSGVPATVKAGSKMGTCPDEFATTRSGWRLLVSRPGWIVSAETAETAPGDKTIRIAIDGRERAVERISNSNRLEVLETSPP